MRDIVLRGAMLIVGIAVAVPASAGEGNGYRAIASGQIDVAERELADHLRLFPTAPDILLNLAALHAREGRMAEAGDLYRKVLAVPDEAMALPGGTVASSHALATVGLGKVRGTAIATR